MANRLQQPARQFFDVEIRTESVHTKCAGSMKRYERAKQSLAGGVSSGLRRTARPFPLYFERGKGSRLTDVDDNEYIDYTAAWGPLILGHAPPELIESVAARLETGFTFGAQHDLEIEAAEMLTRIIPCADRVCFANSGTEVVQVALRLARAFTGRKLFIKFEGHYHGWEDSVLVSYHPSASDLQGQPIPVGAGQRRNDEVLIAVWNDRDSVEKLFSERGSEISAVICEPLLCNSGSIPPQPGFLHFLREITQRFGSVLIFDEVITGFRLDLGGAQTFYGVTPDLATFAKAVGGGYPVGVLAGRAELMEWIANGTVVHAGTLNGAPLALAAVAATLGVLERDAPVIYPRMRRLGAALREGLAGILRDKGIPAVCLGEGAVFQILFQETVPTNYRETLSADRSLYSDFALAMLDEGVLILPDGRWYLTAVHEEMDVEKTLEAARRC